MKTWIKTLAIAAVATLGTAACDDAVTPADTVDTPALRADLATVAADAMFQDLSLMLDPPVLALSDGGPLPASGETRTFTKVVTFFDAAGKKQDRYDALTTASMNVVWDLERSAEAAFWSAEVERHRDMVISGLAGEETQRTWNGTGTGKVERSRHPDGGVVRTYEMEENLTITNVVWGVPRAQNPYPKSGTITRKFEVVVTKDGEVVAERDVTVVVVFNGSSKATVTVGADSWEVDLVPGSLKGALRAKRP
jgi:hypothetical protein